MVKCYYRAGKNKKGFYEPCADVVKRQVARQVLRDASQRRAVPQREASLDEEVAEEYVKEYKERGKCVLEYVSKRRTC